MGGGASLFAQGEPQLWLTGGALVCALLMIVSLVALILVSGAQTFWPTSIERVTLIDGTVYAGEVTRSERYKLQAQALEMLPEAEQRLARVAIQEDDGWVWRRLMRTANFELTGSHFHWFNDFAVTAEVRPPWMMVAERVELGRFYGTPVSILIDGQTAVDATGKTGAAQEQAELAIWQLFNEHHGDVARRRALIRHKEKYELGRQSERAEHARLAMRAAELRHGRDSQQHASAQEEYQRVDADVTEEYGRIRTEIAELQAENDKFQITLTTGQGQTKALRLAEIVRMYPANQLTWTGKLRVYLSRWREFLLDDPREANSEGGVWPAIVGTVTMTLIMALAVVPFGVLAALYLREYAKAGPLTSSVRIAINNLAGVPSIVFGVFGLGFLCYVVGGGIDRQFFPAQVADGNPVFGKGALVWASLTLALLTLPVVIVATEEALAAVPNSMREGSYGCGASKWQTIRRVVLPQALPGIMTGMILAMARGAGEVAPLMLVGAVKLAPELPLDTSWPLLHPSRSFMHLGFHVYDVGFQSQNSEAARPMVFTTTLLLIVIVAVLNVLAVWLRGRLIRRFRSGQI